jgi:hypothetical protein
MTERKQRTANSAHAEPNRGIEGLGEAFLFPLLGLGG